MKRTSKKANADADDEADMTSVITESLRGGSCAGALSVHSRMRVADEGGRTNEITHALGSVLVEVSTDPWPWRMRSLIHEIRPVKADERPDAGLEGGGKVHMAYIWTALISQRESKAAGGVKSPIVLEMLVRPERPSATPPRYERRFYCSYNPVRCVERAADDYSLLSGEGLVSEALGQRLASRVEVERYHLDTESTGMCYRGSLLPVRVRAGGGVAGAPGTGAATHGAGGAVPAAAVAEPPGAAEGSGRVSKDVAITRIWRSLFRNEYGRGLCRSHYGLGASDLDGAARYRGTVDEAVGPDHDGSGMGSVIATGIDCGPVFRMNPDLVTKREWLPSVRYR